MAITSFYLLNMFPRMRTSSLSPNNQHPTPRQNMFPQMRTLHHHLTIITQHPSQTCSLGCALYHHHPTINTQHLSQTCSLRCALYIITQQSTPNTQAKHVPSDAHFTSSPNNQHPTSKPNMFPRMRTLHQHPTIISQQPTAKHVPSDAHFTSTPNNHHPSPNSHERDSIDFSIKLAC